MPIVIYLMFVFNSCYSINDFDDCISQCLRNITFDKGVEFLLDAKVIFIVYLKYNQLGTYSSIRTLGILYLR